MYNEKTYWQNRMKSHGTVQGIDIPIAKRYEILPEEKLLITKYIPHKVDVLDFGIGEGRLLPFFNNRSNYVCGFDIVNYPKCTNIEHCMYVGDIDKTGFDNGQFVYVVSFMVLLHQRPENIESVIKELHRISAGLLIISVWRPDYTPAINEDTYCYTYDYDKLFSAFTIVEMMQCGEVMYYVLKK